MKILTVAIPCYNSQEYMEKSIRSALNGGDRVEIIIVDDGSTDDTLKIARKYQEKFPDIVKVIHQENGGHGEAVNTGIKNATGLYFKVLDSDDCLGKKALTKVLDLLEDMIAKDAGLDMLISNYMYDKQGVKHKKIMKYKRAMPVGKMFGWDELHFGKTQYLLMHSVIYRTKVLRECGMVLPKHTFYVDNIYVFQPLPYVKNIYYLDVCLYKYFIGRDDQSVHESVMIKRLDQQYRVTRLMLDIYNKSDISHQNTDDAMVHYFDMMMCVSSILSILEGSKQRLEDKEKLWDELKISNPELYRKVRKSVLGITMNLPGKVGRKCSVIGYSITQKFFGFN
ncbi:MAG: glycosyltransferase [Eubacterium sp.]|jgi:glycosyltransferase involved in cell wall biosynthesis|nr:glycosyltransferase [Eubacterium sp.]